MFGARGPIFSLGEGESTHTIRAAVVGILVTEHEGVLGIELVINSRTECSASVRRGNSVTKRNDLQVWNQDRSVDHGAVIDVSLLKIEKERGFLPGDWAAQVAAILS